MATVTPVQVALLLFALCLQAVTSEIPVKKDIDIKKMAGKWYPVRSATSEDQPRALHGFALEPTASGGFAMKLEIPQKGSCSVKNLDLTQVSPGVFTSPEGKATVMDTDYTTYMFVELSKDTTRILVYYAREKKVDKKIKKKFRSIVKKAGMKTAKRLIPRKEDMC
ncbi:beta-lactoglobulin-2 [Anolis carolinensis]|uniref:beta-lactoglobulin-2 n=1 Tax=Anolis carolinensis TaxID=28377 RepID=UPI000462AD2D|nr:PREDICTED: beta-lactoglobulin-2 [Anolis carolinensis]|eukprot:XP_008122465.1 PREDICTED: beta-lactoglobulin-2 [Anolis carolinensis]